jgi:FAD/FMN-containing dehydrogenase
MLISNLIQDLQKIVGENNVLSAYEDLIPFIKDWRGIYLGATAAVVRPANTQEVAAVIHYCSQRGIAIVPQGGNTGMCGAAIPNPNGEEIVLSLARMNKIRSIDALNNTLTVDAGCVLAAIQGTAAEVDRLFPLSLGAEGSCQIGGNLSTNAGGVNVLRYGNTRDLVLGLEVVLPDGRIWDGLRSLRKDNTGYDLKQLFIGAEGTLGIITGATLKLFPRPIANATAWMAWRTAFRECVKLKHSLPDVENEYRLSQWLSNTRTFRSLLQNSEWSVRGAEDAVEYYEQVNGDFVELKKSYDWAWLASYAFLKRNLTPGQ